MKYVQKTKEEQKAFNELNSILPFRTTTTINFDGSINTGVCAEKVEWDSSICLGEPTGDAKTKADALDERTLSGNNWDTKTISIVG